MASISHRKRIWGWMMFDFASQPYSTLLLTFIFAPYFASAVVDDPVRGQELWGYTLTIAGLCIAFAAPVLGALADSTGRRMPWIILFSIMYVVGSFGLWWAVPGSSNLVVILGAFVIGLVGMEFATTFTNALLPTLGTREEIGKISGSGWALGYAGGVLALIVMLLFLAENEAGLTFLGNAPAFGLDPEMREGTRSVGPLTAIWYVIFMVPFFLWVHGDDAKRGAHKSATVKKAIADLRATLRRLPQTPSLMAFLGSSMLYRDALGGLYTFGGIYALGVLGWSVVDVGVFGIIAAITAGVSSWATGKSDARHGPKAVILWATILLTLVCITVVTITPTSVLGIGVLEGSSAPSIAFYICGSLIGAGGGSLQASSRTMLVRQSNPARMTEAFGLYALAGKATSFIAPLLIGIVTGLSESQRIGITPVIGLFLLALILLVWVNPEGESAEKWSSASPLPQA
jgi:UMF1 family MFS transporter